MGLRPPSTPGDLLAAGTREARLAALRARNGIRLATGSARPEVAPTPADVVWSRGRARLLRYASATPRYRTPLLVVFSLVGRAYILDLAPGNSFVERLRDEGFDVYLLDFGVADDRDAGNTLDTYAVEYLGDAIAAAVETSAADEVNLVGYCMGGLLALLGAAACPEWPVRSLTTIATPVDLNALGALTNVVGSGTVEVEDLLDSTGNVPPRVVEYAFRAVLPMGRVTQYADLLDGMWSEDYLTAYQQMTGWMSDQVPLAGATAAEVVTELVRSDSLATTGVCRFGGRTVDLADIAVPFRSIVAEDDTIAPAASSAMLPHLVGSVDSAEVRLPGGHVGLFVGRSAHRRSIPLMVDFFAGMSEPTGARTIEADLVGAPG